MTQVLEADAVLQLSAVRNIACPSTHDGEVHAAAVQLLAES